MVLVQHAIGDSKSEWTVSKVFQKLWVRLLEVYDDIKGIKWTWQSLDKYICEGTFRGKMTGWP